jgi:MarR family transcriptional regulator for hemolysin
MRLGTSLAVLQRGYRAAADKAVAHVGVSQTLAYPIVMLGRMNGEVRQGVLAEALGIEGPSLVRSVDQLVEAGLVERREDPGRPPRQDPAPHRGRQGHLRAHRGRAGR